MSTTESLLLRAIALHTQEEIAMQTMLSTSQVQRISTGQAGVTLEHMDAFLGSIGFRIVPADEERVSVSREEMDALRTLASKYLETAAATKAGSLNERSPNA